MMANRKRKTDNVPSTNGEPEIKKSDTEVIYDRSEVTGGQPVLEDEDMDDLPATQQSTMSEVGQSPWTADYIADRLEESGQTEAADKFREENITGSVLDMVTDETLSGMGIVRLGDRLEVLKIIRGLTEPYQRKVFNDSVHGHIELHPLCVKVVDTPQFQRLRYLKQLGACYYVYPGAAHNRFEHCIGVCHLAGQLVRSLKKRQPELDITNKDILCVELAGLCHDLGHGPFSHMFDGKFIPTVRKNSNWKHEDGSVMMFDHLLTSNNLREEFERYGLDDRDIEFIKEQIAGPQKQDQKTLSDECEWQYHGRDKKKGFLYEIVANKRNGIDVDKWDYFARDCHGLGIKNNFDHHRFMKFSRVIEVDGSFQICSRDKEADSLYSMFQIRATLHRRAYQHRVCNAIEIMITDALIKANNKPLIPGLDGALRKISECIDDPVAFTNLNDSIFHLLLFSTDDELQESRDILHRVECRQLYKCVGETTPTQNKTKDDIAEIKRGIVSKIPVENKESLKEQDLVVHLVYLDYGMKKENPIKNVRFYNKNDVKKAISLDEHHVSLMLPKVFAEQLIRLYCKKTDDESLKLATNCFQKWCDDIGLLALPSQTPLKQFWKQDSLTPDKNDLTTPDKPTQHQKSTPVSAGKFKQRLSFE